MGKQVLSGCFLHGFHGLGDRCLHGLGDRCLHCGFLCDIFDCRCSCCCDILNFPCPGCKKSADVVIVHRSWCLLAFRHGEFPVSSQANHGYRVRWNMNCPVVKRCDGFTDRQKLLLDNVE